MPSPNVEAFQHYRVLRRDDGSLWELGRGEMGVTYKALDPNLQKLFALKVINARYLDDESACERFKREARAAASLDHPNIAHVYHLGWDAQSFFYAMEFIDGETLENYVARVGPLPVAQVLDIASQVCGALEEVHAIGLVHRDIKPANIMLVTKAGRQSRAVKIIDFGLVKVVVEGQLEDGKLVKTHRTGFMGTPAYASPEQCEDLPTDTRSDIYSLGVTLWFALTGHPTFHKGSVLAILNQHISKPPPLDELPTGVPEIVRVLLTRMLAKEAGDRPQTPTDLYWQTVNCQTALAAEEVAKHAAAETSGWKAATEPAAQPASAADTVISEPYTFTLAELLRERAHLDWQEVHELLAPLAAVIDELAAGGVETLAGFGPRRVRAIFPVTTFSIGGETDQQPRPALRFQSPKNWLAQWPDFRLVALHAPDTHSSKKEDIDTTAVPSARRFGGASQAFAALVCELLSGTVPVPGNEQPIMGSLPTAVNAVLHRALSPFGGNHKHNAEELRLALEQAAQLKDLDSIPVQVVSVLSQPPIDHPEKRIRSNQQTWWARSRFSKNILASALARELKFDALLLRIIPFAAVVVLVVIAASWSLGLKKRHLLDAHQPAVFSSQNALTVQASSPRLSTKNNPTSSPRSLTNNFVKTDSLASPPNFARSSYKPATLGSRPS